VRKRVSREITAVCGGCCGAIATITALEKLDPVVRAEQPFVDEPEVALGGVASVAGGGR